MPTSPPAPGRSRSARATRPIRPTRTFARPPIWSSVRRMGSSTCRSPSLRRSLNPVSVHYSTFDSTAAAGTSAATAPTTSPPQGRSISRRGRRPRSFACRSSTARSVEAFEAFTFKLDTEHNGVISRASGRISIVDNDTIVATPKLFVRDAVVDEKDGNALVSVLLGGPAGQASNSTVTVHYATANGTANGSDYTAAGDTLLSFAPGETAKTVVVPIADDGADGGGGELLRSASVHPSTPTSPPAPGRSRSARATRPIRPTRTFARPPIWSSARRMGSSTCRSLCLRRA